MNEIAGKTPVTTWVEQIYLPSWYERYGDPYSECWIDEDGTEVCESFAYEEGYVDGPAPAHDHPARRLIVTLAG